MVFGILAIIANLPGILGPHAKINAHESSAVGSLRTINTAEVTYSATYPKQGYSPSLEALGGADCSTVKKENACLIDQSLASGTHSAYSFTYVPGDELPVTHYTVHADPLPAAHAPRHFYTDETGVIRAESDRPATAQSPSL